MLKKLFGSLAFILIIFIVVWNIRPRPHHLKSLLFTPEVQTSEGLSIQFIGNTNILFDDGHTRILTDGFFSRPNAYSVLFGKVAPNEKRIKRCLDRAGISELDAVIPVHSHFDHAMDAPVVAKLTRAQLLGSSSTMMIGKGLELADDQMQVAPLDTIMTIGQFTIRFIRSKHWQYPDEKQRERLLDQSINEIIIPPASIFDYKEGISYTILIEHGDLSIAIQGTAGFREHSIPEFNADILFMAIAGLEVMEDDYNQKYQEHVIDAVDPDVIVPIHWDDFTLPLSRGLKTTNLPFNMKSGSNLGKAFEIISENNPKRQIRILPLWERINAKELAGGLQ